MVMKAEINGREALMRKLNSLAPKVEKYAAQAKIEAAEELAAAIQDKAPIGKGAGAGDYAASIEADVLANRPHQEQVGIQKTKDPSATGVFASFIWRFLEWGTAPHNTAKGGGTALGHAKHREGGGTQHPGTRPQPHIFSTYNEMKPKLKKKVRTAVNKAVREAMGK